MPWEAPLKTFGNASRNSTAQWRWRAISVPGVKPPGCLRKRWLDVVMQDIRANGLIAEDIKQEGILWEHTPGLIPGGRSGNEKDCQT